MMATTDAHARPPRFADLSIEQLEGRQKEVAQKILGFSLNGLNGPFNMMLRSPDATDIILQLSDYLRFRTAIPQRLAELAILVHARIWGDQYEWDMHAGRAASCGVTADTIEALRIGQTPATMPHDERSIFDFAVRLVKRRPVPDDGFAAVLGVLGEQGVADLTIMLGQYATISMILCVSEAGSGRFSMPSVNEEPFAQQGTTDTAS